jgi:hypothetical protein
VSAEALSIRPYPSAYRCECGRLEGEEHIEECRWRLRTNPQVVRGEEVLTLSFEDLAKLLGVEHLEVVGVQQATLRIDAFYVAGLQDRPEIHIRVRHPFAMRQYPGGARALVLTTLEHFKKRVAKLLAAPRVDQGTGIEDP